MSPITIKIFLNIQTNQDIQSGEVTRLTAELKDLTRLRDFKQYDADSAAFFNEVYRPSIENFKDMNARRDPARYDYVIGRLHRRAARDSWIPDALCIARLNTQRHVEYVYLSIDGQEYEMDMTQELTANQQNKFYSSGLWGKIVTNKVIKRWNEIAKTRI